MGKGHLGLFRLAMVFAILTTPYLTQSARAELTAQQKQFLATIDGRLKQAEANLKAAEESAGPADQKPTESRVNLSLSRSGNARAQLKSVTDALAKLPADDAAVKAGKITAFPLHGNAKDELQPQDLLPLEKAK